MQVSPFCSTTGHSSCQLLTHSTDFLWWGLPSISVKVMQWDRLWREEQATPIELYSKKETWEDIWGNASPTNRHSEMIHSSDITRASQSPFSVSFCCLLKLGPLVCHLFAHWICPSQFSLDLLAIPRIPFVSKLQKKTVCDFCALLAC